MDKYAQVNALRRKTTGDLARRESLGAQQSKRERVVSQLFRTCIRLQAALDRRFLQLNFRWQEANVLLRCVKAGRIAPSQLAAIVGRDAGKITAYIDRLEAKRCVTHRFDRHNRRLSSVCATAKGRRVAKQLARMFRMTRRELFAELSEADIRRFAAVLPQLYRNAVRIGGKRPEADKKSQFSIRSDHPKQLGRRYA